MGEITQSGVDATRSAEFIGFSALCKNPVSVHGVEADGTIQRMRRFINPILLWFARSNHDDLVRQLQFLMEENRILRAKLPRPIRITPEERERLILFGRLVGPAIRHLVSIVTSRTFDRWLNGETWQKGTRPRKPGRPRTPEQIRRLIVRIARETSWGYTRILGELKKLGIESVSRSTVVNILKEHGLEPGPRRGDDTWDGFIQRHAMTLWACDFLSIPVLTCRGWRDAYVLLFINVLTRRCWVTPSTLHPTRSWTKEQGIAFVEAHPRTDDPNAPTMLLRDRDGKYGPRFDSALRKRGVTPIALQHCSPNMNAYAERMVQTLQQECLDHFVVCGRRHLDHLVREYLAHYHAERPHQGVGNVPLRTSPVGSALSPRGQPARASPLRLDQIACDERLGGLLRHYRWRAAA